MKNPRNYWNIEKQDTIEFPEPLNCQFIKDFSVRGKHKHQLKEKTWYNRALMHTRQRLEESKGIKAVVWQA